MAASIENVSIFDVQVRNITITATLDRVLEMREALSLQYVVTPNAHHFVNIFENEEIRKYYQTADLCVNDSKIVSLFLKLFGIALTTVRGSDLTAALMAKLNEDGRSVMLVGLDEQYLDSLKCRYPNMAIAHYNPPFGFIRDNAEVHRLLDCVEAATPAVVLLAVGTPQQEQVAYELASRGRRGGVALCVGASVNFLAGAERRAPKIAQRLALEWLWRMLKAPRRLWRRYVLIAPRFFFYAAMKHQPTIVCQSAPNFEPRSAFNVAPYQATPNPMKYGDSRSLQLPGTSRSDRSEMGGRRSR